MPGRNNTPLTFVTGNKHKFAEAKRIIPDLQQANIDLIELQSLDAKVIVKEKLTQARAELGQGNIFVEDTGLKIDAFKGFPGPLVKWTLDSVGPEGIWRMLSGFENKHARIETTIGYADLESRIHFFTAELEVRIVPPRGSSGFGFDSIVEIPKLGKTIAELSSKEKDKISTRASALGQLFSYIQSE